MNNKNEFNKNEYLKLVYKYYGLQERGYILEKNEFFEKNIENTVYEKYFDYENISKEKTIKRIKKGFEKLKKYNLENIFLLGVSENNSEYMLPLVEKNIFNEAEKNNCEMQQTYHSLEEDEICYTHSSYLYDRKKLFGEYLFDFGTIMGVVENFEEKEYREVTEDDEKTFIKMIKILENNESFSMASKKLFESKMFSVQEIKKVDKSEFSKDMSVEEKEIFKGVDMEKMGEAFLKVFSVDNKRCSGIVNGLWILGILRTEENITGTYDYMKMITENAMFGFPWFSDDYIVDYETIKKYFGKYNLIREFCDERLKQEKIEEENAIINYLNKVNKAKEFSIKEYKGIIKDFTYEEKKENLTKISNYLEKEINLDDNFVYADDNEKRKYTAEEMFKYFRSLLKPREETFDSIRQWLLETIRQEDKMEFPTEKLLNDTKMFDEEERMRTFNVLKYAIDREDYKIKLENGEVLKGDNLTKYFGNLLEIAVENKVAEEEEAKEKKL